MATDVRIYHHDCIHTEHIDTHAETDTRTLGHTCMHSCTNLAKASHHI